MELFLLDEFFGINKFGVEKFFAEALHYAVVNGDIDELERLLDEPGADINSVYYGENLLWTAIMNNQQEMARCLIDNGIDTSFQCCRVDILEPEEREKEKKEKPAKVTKGQEKKSQKVKLATIAERKDTESPQSDIPSTPIADLFPVSCRELAYEKEMLELVKLIDFKEGCMLRTWQPPNHEKRILKSPEERLREFGVLACDYQLDYKESPLKDLPEPKPRHKISKASKSAKSISIPTHHDFSMSTNLLTVPTSDALSVKSEDSVTSTGSNPTQRLSSPTPYPVAPLSPKDNANSRAQSHYRLTKSFLCRKNFTYGQGDLNLRHAELSDIKKSPKMLPTSVADFKFERRMSKSAKQLTTVTISDTSLLQSSKSLRHSANASRRTSYTRQHERPQMSFGNFIHSVCRLHSPKKMLGDLPFINPHRKSARV